MCDAPRPISVEITALFCALRAQALADDGVPSDGPMIAADRWHELVDHCQAAADLEARRGEAEVARLLRGIADLAYRQALEFERLAASIAPRPLRTHQPKRRPA